MRTHIYCCVLSTFTINDMHDNPFAGVRVRPEPGFRLSVPVRLTEGWSCFSRMMLWWSDCSAAAVLMQLAMCNNKYVHTTYETSCVVERSLSKLLRQLWKWPSIYMRLHINENRKKYTSQMAKTWMRLKMFQVTYKTISCWSVSTTGHMLKVWVLKCWNSVALEQGMHLYMWVGFVSSRWNNE